MAADLMPLDEISVEARQAAAIIRARAGGAPLDIGFVLGTGLGPLADAVEDAIAIPYADLPGFSGRAGVTGHAKRLVIGRLEGKRVAMMQGRAHYYEKGDASVMRGPLETMLALGASRMFLTNSAGSLRPDWAMPGIATIADHIAFSGPNPLIGIEGDRRFVPLVDCYSPRCGRSWRRHRARPECQRRKASTCGSPVRPSRRRRKSAWRRRWEPILSACRRFPKPFSAAIWGWKSSRHRQ